MTGSMTQRWSRPSGRARHRALTGVLVLLVVAPFVWGLSQLRVETNLESFLPRDDPQLTAYEALSTEFGSDPIVVLLETKGDDALLSPSSIGALLEAEGKLSRLPDVTSVYGPATTLNQIAGQAQAIVAELMGRRDAEIAKAQVKARKLGEPAAAVDAAGDKARNAFDARYGPLLVQAMPVGLPTLKNPKFAARVIFDEDGRPRAQWRSLVPNHSSLAIVVRPTAGLDAEGTSRVVRAVRSTMEHSAVHTSRTTVTGSPVVVDALSRRSVAEAPLLGGLAILAIGACLWIGRSGRVHRRLAPLAVTCLAVLATLGLLGLLDRPVNLGVVAFCPVLLGIGVYYPSYFALGARARTVLTVAAATSASLATLMLSPLPIIRDLGATLAVGVLMAAGLGLASRHWLGAEPGDGGDAGEPDRPPASPARVGLPRPAVVGALVLTALVAVFGWSRVTHLGVQSDVSYFAGGLPALHEAEHVEDVIGSSGELDLVASGPVTSPAALAWQGDAEREIAVKHGERFRAAASLASLLGFLGDDPTPSEVDAGLRMLPAYLTSAVLNDDRTKALSSFGVRLEDLPRLGREVDTISREIASPPDGVDARLVGLPLVLVRAQQLVEGDRLSGSIWGIAAAVAVLLIGLRRRGDAVRAAAAALVATGLTFATLALSGRSLDPVTASLGALTAAVGCEFTIVYAEAVRRGSRRLRRTVVLVAATSTAGYLVLAISGMTAVRGLGLLLAVAVVQALLAAVLVVAVTVRPGATAAAQLMPNEQELAHV